MDFCNDYHAMHTNLVNAGVKYINNNPTITSMVVGMSGGVDSTVTAALARQVADRTGIKLYGYSMPILTNLPDELMRADAAGRRYCHEFEVKPLGDGFMLLLSSIDNNLFMKISQSEEMTVDEKIRAGNIKARTRMIHLYNIARMHNGMVLSTDNYTELLLGFWTLHGDVGDFGFLQNLWKTEVFGLAKYIGGDCAECADAKPTDGLGVTDNDLEQLLPGWGGGYQEGYHMVDEILADYLKAEEAKKMRPFTGVVPAPIFNDDHPVIKRHLATAYKRENPFNVSRDSAIR